ncbi:MAG TPA: hypothetical protein VJS19_08390 [Candidatus Dormibacteraeota bacterium]|nr:hypothetical protein [Candidatus Dormibacteraeota bacterium]
MPPETVELLAVAAASLAFAVAFAPAAASRRTLLVRGTAGLAGSAAIAAVPTLDIAVLVLLALGALHAAVAGTRPFAARLRPPVIAAALLALGLALIKVGAPDLVGRFAAVGLVAGLAAAVGVLPYLHPIETDEALTASPVAWLGFVGPVLATVVVVRSQGVLTADAGGAFGAMLVGLGLLNMAWGGLAAWLTADEVSAWRYSFVADWGLVLCGFGLTVADGRRGAMLVLISILAGRLPLYLISRQAIREKSTTRRPINLVVAAALAGSAPFVGFGARILLLRASTQLYWPLAIVLALVMLLWLPGSLRLGRSLGQPRGRQALGVALILAVNAAAGLYPLPLLAAAHL